MIVVVILTILALCAIAYGCKHNRDDYMQIGLFSLFFIVLVGWFAYGLLITDGHPIVKRIPAEEIVFTSDDVIVRIMDEGVRREARSNKYVVCVKAKENKVEVLKTTYKNNYGCVMNSNYEVVETLPVEKE